MLQVPCAELKVYHGPLRLPLHPRKGQTEDITSGMEPGRSQRYVSTSDNCPALMLLVSGVCWWNDLPSSRRKWKEEIKPIPAWLSVMLPLLLLSGFALRDCAVPSAFRSPLISSTENFILWKDMVITSHLSLKTVLFYPPVQQWPLWQFLASRSFCAGALAVIHWKENWLFAQILQVSRDPGYWRIGENCSKVSTLNLFCVSFPRAFPTTSKTGVLLHEWHSASKAPGQIPLGPADLFPWQWCGFLCVQCGSETVTKH